MNPILLNILAGCATQAVLSMFLWHRNLLSLPERVERIEADLKDIKAELQGTRAEFREEMRSTRFEFKEDMRSLRVEFQVELKSMRAEFKEEMRELRGLILQLNERVDKLYEKIK